MNDPGIGDAASTLKFEISFLSRPRTIIATICNLAFASLCSLAAPAYYFDWPQVQQGSTAGEEVLVGLVVTLLAMLAFWFAILNIWRLLGPDFDVRVRDDGLLLHPAGYHKPIPWTHIKRSRVKKTQGGDRTGYWYNRLELELIEPIWSLTFLIPTKTVTISSPRRWGHNPAIAELGRHVRAHRLDAGWKR